MFDPFTAAAGLTGIFLLAWIAVVIVVIATSVFWIIELVDCARREFPTVELKIVWLAVIAFSHIIGSLLYYFIGKQQGYLPNTNPNSYTRRY